MSIYVGTDEVVEKPREFTASSPMLSLKRVLVSAIIATIALASGFTSIFLPARSEVQAWDPVTDVVCLFSGNSEEDGQGVNFAITLLELKDTNKYQWMVYSKSSSNFGISNVEDDFLNGILNFSKKGDSFEEVNEKIIGRPLDRFVVADEDKGEFNAGSRVNPYDRFGVAGMNFTSYLGEWKYVAVDVCSDNPQPTETDSGLFYDGRLSPKSTWDEAHTSNDPRSQAVIKDAFLRWFYFSGSNLAANIIFWITKFIVVVCLAFIGFSFTDFSSLIGLDEIIAGNGSNDGVVAMLFEGLFFPMSVLAITVVGVMMIWQGIAKRQYRKAFTTAAQSVVVFFLSIVFFANVSQIITIPNKSAVVLQAMIAESMNLGTAGGDGICESGERKFVAAGSSSESFEDSVSLLEKASAEMASSVGCQFWQTLLFQPWSQAQWGDEWSNLYANPDGSNDENAFTIPEDPNGEVNYLENDNYEWVGNASVPMGDGEFEHNWALFNISVQTNAHSPLGHDGSISQVTNDISNDWWRIVDATSNYKEIPYVDSPLGERFKDTEADHSGILVADPDIEVTEEWHHWTGKSPFAKLGYVLLSLVVAFIAVIAPGFFSIFVVLYSIGVEILLIFFPVVMLLALMSNWGLSVAKEWAKLLLQLFLKRLFVGVLAVLSISFTASAMNVMQTQGLLQGLFMMVALTAVLIISRKKILDLLTNFSFTNSSMSRVSERLSGIGSNAATVSAKSATGATVGAFVGARRGGTLRDAVVGAKEGASVGYTNRSKRNAFTRNFTQSRMGEGFNFNEGAVERQCAMCRAEIKEGGIAWRAPDGLYYCDECGNMHQDNLGLRQVSTSRTADFTTRTKPSFKLKKRTSESGGRELAKSVENAASETYVKRDSLNASGGGEPVDLSKQEMDQIKSQMQKDLSVAIDEIEEDAKRGVFSSSLDNLGILGNYVDSEELLRALNEGDYPHFEGLVMGGALSFWNDFEGDVEAMRREIDESAAQRVEEEVRRDGDDKKNDE